MEESSIVRYVCSLKKLTEFQMLKWWIYGGSICDNNSQYLSSDRSETAMAWWAAEDGSTVTLEGLEDFKKLLMQFLLISVALLLEKVKKKK